MPSINGRINGQTDYNPAVKANASWREEMLGDLLNQMRSRQLPQEVTAPAPKMAQIPGKGHYVDIYV